MNQVELIEINLLKTEMINFMEAKKQEFLKKLAVEFNQEFKEYEKAGWLYEAKVDLRGSFCIGKR